jgi:predicted amidophosphoribosyltransferase
MTRCKNFVASFLDFLFPPFCLCCRQLVGIDRTTLCQHCFDSLRLVDPSKRCDRCGLSKEGEVHRCQDTALEGACVCFDDGPVVRSLLNSADLLSPFVIVQWQRLGWPMPDYVLPTPGDWFSRGGDRWKPRQEIAANVAALFGRKASSALRLERYRLPIPYLSLEEQAKEVDWTALRLHRPERFVNKTILLIHDSLSTGRALRASATALCQNGAFAVFGISVM